VPYHCLPDGADLAQVPVEQFAGEALILDLRGYPAGTGIPAEDVQRAAQRAGGIQAGDILFCMTGWSQYYGTPQYKQSPFVTGPAIRWLIDQGIKVLGIDTMGAMDPDVPDRQNHLPLFQAGLVYIENLANLEAIPDSRVVVAALPPAIHGLEAFPVRVVALLGQSS
jgi:kynurenine formamidase